MTTANSLEQIRALINNGQTEQALTLVQSRDTRAVHDPALHLAWADLLEELGLVDEVVQELNLAIRDDPEDKGTYNRLAEIYLDQGRLDRAAHTWGALAQKFPREAPEGLASPPEPAPRLPVAPPVFNLDQDPQFQFILAKCPVLKAIGDKVHQTSMLSKDETMVLIHTLGHLEHGPEAVNELFQRCINADPALFLKSRLRGNPMSCPKIRSRIPQVTSTVACNCAFNLGSNLYPTPLIHLQEMGAGASSPILGLTVDSLQFQNLLQEYLKLRQQLHETKILLERYETRLSEFFTEIGVESVATAMGRLCCRKKEGGGTTFTLEL